MKQEKELIILTICHILRHYVLYTENVGGGMEYRSKGAVLTVSQIQNQPQPWKQSEADQTFIQRVAVQVVSRLDSPTNSHQHSIIRPFNKWKNSFPLEIRDIPLLIHSAVMIGLGLLLWQFVFVYILEFIHVFTSWLF